MLLLTVEDEELFLAAVRARVADVAVIDGSRWPTASPPLVDRMSEARDSIVYLWSPSASRHLPIIERAGMFDGPNAGPVIQWERSRECVEDGTLRSGSLSAGYNRANKELDNFADHVWGAFKSVTTGGVKTLTGREERSARVGPHAKERALVDQRYLRHASVEVFYVVA
jgi:hypothetical protein